MVLRPLWLSKTMSTAESETFLACHRLAEAALPPERLRALLEAAGGDPCHALSLRTGLTPRQVERLERAATAPLPTKALATAAELGVWACPLGSAPYPDVLRHFEDSPPILFVRGTLPPSQGLAIVGSRRSTSYGKGQATHFATAFVEAGFTVVSGGAAGIDTAAHAGALQAGGTTVAVVACGLDYVYPAENRGLFEKIVAQGGAIVSEFSVGTRPEPWRFPARGPDHRTQRCRVRPRCLGGPRSGGHGTLTWGTPPDPRWGLPRRWARGCSRGNDPTGREPQPSSRAAPPCALPR